MRTGTLEPRELTFSLYSSEPDGLPAEQGPLSASLWCVGLHTVQGLFASSAVLLRPCYFALQTFSLVFDLAATVLL